MIKLSLKTAAMALAIPALAVASPSQAATPAHAAPVAQQAAWADMTFEHGRDRYRDRYDRRSRYDRYDRYDRRHRGYRGEPIYRDTRIWRGRDGRYYCRRENGTTGLLIGAAVGGLIGNEVAGRGDRTLGALLGAAGGAILGRSIDRSNSRCR